MPLPIYDRQPTPLLIVLSGPSGVGKDATLRRMKEMGCPFYFVVTATTRPRRPGEVHGVDYFFISLEEYQHMLAQNEFLEHAEVYGYHYGVPKQQVRDALKRGKDVILRIDVQGAATVRALVPEAVFIFLIPSSEEELVRRLKNRKTEAGNSLDLRINMARQEMQRLSDFDYVVVNREEELDETVTRIMAIIQAEKCRVKQRKIEL